MTQGNLHAVATGDVVHSTAMPAPARAALPGVLKEAYAAFRTGREVALPHDIDVFRGDGWQVYLAQPDMGLALVLYLRAALREKLEVDVRSALAIDHIDFLEPTSVSASDGLAFRRSGLALTELDRSTRFGILPPERLDDDEHYALTADGIADPVDLIARQWTPAQAQAIRQMLLPYPEEPRQQDISDAWQPAPISQPAVNKHLRNANWEWIARALGRYHRFVQILPDAVASLTDSDARGSRPSTSR